MHQSARLSQKCNCGCGVHVGGRRFVSGHNLRVMNKTEAHRRAIGEGQRRAWRTKRARKPIGSTQIDEGGYVRVKVVAGAGTWRLEHVIVMESIVGRPLRRGEIVHHVNGDRQDNRPTNLYLCRSKAHHAEIHRSEAAAFRVLLAAGAVTFTEGRYEAVLQAA